MGRPRRDRGGVEAPSARRRRARLRTAYVVADGEAGAPDPGLVNAALMCATSVVTGLSERSVSVLRGLLSGTDASSDLAEALGISPSAVSQRVRADGLAAIVAAHELIEPAEPRHGEGGGDR